MADRKLRVGFWLIAGTLGVLQAWSARYQINSDGLSYLDIADLLWSGDWDHAFNGIWSPGYPFLLGLALRVARPPMAWESTVVLLTNVLIFACTMGCFDFFLRQLHRYHLELGRDRGSVIQLGAWEPILIVFGYVLFIWSSTRLITVDRTSPDMLVAGLVYLTCGLLVLMRRGSSSYVTCALFGAVLGLGYVAKAPLLPMALVFVAVAWRIQGHWRRAAPRTLVTVGTLAAIAIPLVLKLSSSAGHLTFGESGAYNYARTVNNITIPVHWQGWPSGSGTPKHPSRTLFVTPDVFEFGEPVLGSYPPWQDPAYWYAGITPHFALGDQLRVLGKSFDVFVQTLGISPGLVFAGVLLFYMSPKKRMTMAAVMRQWFLWIPCVAALGMFSLVLLEPRYAAPFITIGGLVVVSSVVVVNSRSVRRLVDGVTVVGVAFWLVSLGTEELAGGRSAVGVFVDLLRTMAGSDAGQGNVSMLVARTLRDEGIREGDRVAYIGESYRFYWARLAGVRINAEIRQFDPDASPSSFAADWARARFSRPEYRHVDVFWAAPAGLQQAVTRALAGSGSKAIVTDAFPARGGSNGWLRVSGTTYYILILAERSPRVSQRLDAADDQKHTITRDGSRIPAP